MNEKKSARMWFPHFFVGGQKDGFWPVLHMAPNHSEPAHLGWAGDKKTANQVAEALDDALRALYLDPHGEPEVLAYGVHHDGWCISFKDWKEANTFAAKHGERVRYLVSAKQLPALLGSATEPKTLGDSDQVMAGRDVAPK